MVLENFIVFEGIDGAGTTTQMNLLEKRPEKEKLYLSSEPTPGVTGCFLRSILKGTVNLDPRTIAYIFAADRNEHIYGDGGLLHHIRTGKIAVSDRYIFSSLAYQSQNCGMELPVLLNKNFPLPQILFYFDIQPEQSLKRIQSREVQEIYEKAEFLNKVTESYKKILKEYETMPEAAGMRIVYLDATKPKEETEQIIWSHLAKLPILKA